MHTIANTPAKRNYEPDAHGKSVDVLVHLIQEGNGLHDHVIGTVNVELDLTTRVAVTQTELSTLKITLLELLEELVAKEADTTDEIQDDLAGIALVTKTILDRSSKGLLSDTQD